MLNVAYVYATAEIGLGIIPTPIGYAYKIDLKIINYSDNNNK